MLAFYTELGPYNYKYNPGVAGSTEFVLNKNAWNNNAHVLFLDQPIGTGFSFAKFYNTRYSQK
jgi:serine carboxypeptidase-like clade I